MASDDILRDYRGRFQRGKLGGPGRPVGSLSWIKAPPSFFRDAIATYERYGNAALEQLVRTDPARFFLIMIAIESGEIICRRRRTKSYQP